MKVVADTSPLRYLALIGQSELLHRLFGMIHCPATVRLEASHPKAPVALRTLMEKPPAWLGFLPAHSVTDAALAEGLDAGEAEAITMALLYQADVVLMDDRDGRRLATERGLRVAGTLNILADAAARGWLDYAGTVAQLRTATNFRASDEVVEEAYRRALSRIQA